MRVATVLLVLTLAVVPGCSAFQERAGALLEAAIVRVEERVPAVVDGALGQVEERLDAQIDRLPQVVDDFSASLAAKVAGDDAAPGLSEGIAGVIAALVVALVGWVRNRKSDVRKEETEKALAELKGKVEGKLG